MEAFAQLLAESWQLTQPDETSINVARAHRDRLRGMFADLTSDEREALLPIATLLSRRITEYERRESEPENPAPPVEQLAVREPESDSGEYDDAESSSIEWEAYSGGEQGTAIDDQRVPTDYAAFDPGADGDENYASYEGYDGGYVDDENDDLPEGRATPDDERPQFYDGLLARMNVEDWRPGQRDTVKAALEGRDSLVIMPTGGGKSLCYQLAALAYDHGLTVVVSPLIALIHDQHSRLREHDHPADALVGGMNQDEARAVYARLHAGETRILFVAPERFGSLALRRALAANSINLFVIDEAHCISEWGHDFRPDYLRLPAVIESLGHPPIMALTATATPERAAEISNRLGLRDPLETHGGFDRRNLTFDVIALGGKGAVAEKRRILVEGLRRPDMTPAIVYCGTRKDVETVAETLTASGIDAVGYHAGMDALVRQRAQAGFLGGQTSVMVATNAFGMGIDKADIRSVWHWALPTSVEGYYQEAGRAGRDGAPSRAVLLSMRADLGRLISFNRRRSVEIESVERYHAQLTRRLGVTGGLVSPDSDEERTSLAVLERAGALQLKPARGGQLRATIISGMNGSVRRAAMSAIGQSREMGWNAYRSVERFSATHDTCRRRQILDHFGDPSEPAPQVRCCDVCEPPEWLSEVRASAPPIPGKRRSAPANSSNGPLPNAPEIDVDQDWLARLTEWRRERSNGKPAYTVCTNASLVLIADLGDLSDSSLMSVKGIGQSFVTKHAESLRDLASDR